MTVHKIAVIPGDGIGVAVTESALAVAAAVLPGSGFEATMMP